MFDREAILAAVDLPALADDLLGLRKGSERSRSWGCPNPDHYQTGRTPPVNVFITRWGEPRWHCHGCGNGGTAIDLVMQVRGVNARAALAELARRTGIPDLPARHAPRPVSHNRRTRQTEAPPRPWSPEPVPELERYVAQCAEVLWRPQGAPIRRWLTETRHLSEDVLRINRIGADLGRRRQDRPDGVPAIRRAVVLPALTNDGQACHVQLRTLSSDPDFPRYLSCRDTLARNPRLSLIRPAERFDYPFERTDLIVTEGVIDALSAATAGYMAAAYLGVEQPDRATAVTLARYSRRLIIAFDPDPAGRAGADRLSQLLRERRRDAAVMDLRSGDLNSCLVKSTEWPLEMAGRIQHAAARLAPPRPDAGISIG